MTKYFLWVLQQDTSNHYSVSLRIQSECGKIQTKIQTRITPNMDTLSSGFKLALSGSCEISYEPKGIYMFLEKTSLIDV